jgi:hypothetical protein
MCSHQARRTMSQRHLRSLQSECGSYYATTMPLPDQPRCIVYVGSTEEVRERAVGRGARAWLARKCGVRMPARATVAVSAAPCVLSASPRSYESGRARGHLCVARCTRDAGMPTRTEAGASPLCPSSRPYARLAPSASPTGRVPLGGQPDLGGRGLGRLCPAPVSACEPAVSPCAHRGLAAVPTPHSDCPGPARPPPRPRTPHTAPRGAGPGRGGLRARPPAARIIEC